MNTPVFWGKHALLSVAVQSPGEVELTKFGEQILRGDEQQLYEAIQDC